MRVRVRVRVRLGWVVYGRFLTASRMVGGIRWWRGSGVALVSRGGGGVGRWAALLRQSRATATVRGDSQERLRRRLRGERPRSGEWGSRWLPPVAACGRLRPGFPVASSPYGSRPVRWYQVGSQSWWSSISDLTPPARPAWLRPPKRRGIRDNPGLWCGRGPLGEVQRRPGGVCVWCGNPSHRRGCPGFPVASAVLAQPSRTGRCQAGRNRWPATVIRLDTAQAGMVPSGRRSGGESGTKATTSSDRQPSSATPTPRSEAARAQAPPEAS